MATRFGLLTVLLVLIISSCQKSTEPEPAGHKRIFESDLITITADTLPVASDAPLELVVRCLPLYSCRGRIGLHGNGSKAGTRWAVESPVHDTLAMPIDFDSVLWVPAEFSAGVPFEKRWTVRLLDVSQYSFAANAFADTLLIPDTVGVPFTSDAARRYLGNGTYDQGIGSSLIFLQRVK